MDATLLKVHRKIIALNLGTKPGLGVKGAKVLKNKIK